MRCAPCRTRKRANNGHCVPHLWSPPAPAHTFTLLPHNAALTHAYAGTHDTQGVGTDDAIPLLLEAAAGAGLVVGFHLEPYPGRTAASVRADVEYIVARYGSHPALHRSVDGRPVFFVYDSYHIPARDWAAVLKPAGSTTVRYPPTHLGCRGPPHCPPRPPLLAAHGLHGQSYTADWCRSLRVCRGTPADGVFVGLWLSRNDGAQLHEGGFDAAYSYFASAGFSFGSTPRNWPSMADFCHAHGMAFVPSVGPGYDDGRIRPW